MGNNGKCKIDNEQLLIFHTLFYEGCSPIE